MNTTNDKLDLRVRRTYKFLWDALIVLMSERDFESVTVTDICERAMVHRTTFYKHYEDKYGLLFQGIQDELDALFAALDGAVDQSTTMDEAAATRARLRAVFERIRQQQHFYRLMLGGAGIGRFYSLFRTSLSKRLVRRAPDSQPPPLRTALLAQAHAGMIVSAAAWWLENDCPCTPSELGQYLWEDVFS